MLCEGTVRFLLNVIRLSTITMLVMVATTQLIETCEQSKHTSEWVDHLSGTNGYIDGYDIPTHFMGPVWSLLCHLALFVQCFILVLSELYDKVYDKHIPLIGSNYGLLFSSLWQFSIVFSGLSHHQMRKSALVGLYALAIIACINFLLGVVGTKVKEARSLCSIDAWCSVLPPPFSWIVKLIARCSKSRRVSREMRDHTRWSFVNPSDTSQKSRKGSAAVLKGIEKMYDRYSSRKEPFTTRSETPLPRYSDDKHHPFNLHKRDDSTDQGSLSSKRSVKFSARPTSIIPDALNK